MNIYYYLYYKISTTINKKGNNVLGVIAALTWLLGLNVGIIYSNLLKINNNNFKDYKIGIIIIAIILFVTNCILFFNKKRRSEIENKFINESLKSKRIGGFLVVTYIIITFLLLFS